MAIIALVVFVAGCVDSGTTNNTTSNITVPDIPSKTYAKDGISFKYPESWTKSNVVSKTTNTLAIVADPDSADSSGNYNTLAAIQTVALPSNMTLKEAYDSIYSNYENDSSYVIVSQRVFTIDGTTAYENIHKIKVNGVTKKERATWLEKNGTIYVILCGTLPSDFDSQQTNFDLITYSFKVTA
ncbi:MAG: hypothetical protein CVV28_08870 [Methanobacteriales archaeon HGW-Methanobacteriales-1]|nr:MAG: hypothetical protein CVV28_08870 [Methanobacteriales archaeon HGW-Methanobacteriales-1]